MKPAALDIQRLAEGIYERQWDDFPLHPLSSYETAQKVAAQCFLLARAFAEVAEEEFRAARAAADKERADRKLDEANR